MAWLRLTPEGSGVDQFTALDDRQMRDVRDGVPQDIFRNAGRTLHEGKVYIVLSGMMKGTCSSHVRPGFFD